jgi:hypothetical protein
MAGSVAAQLGLLPREGVRLRLNSTLHCAFPNGAAYSDQCFLGCIDGYVASDVQTVRITTRVAFGNCTMTGACVALLSGRVQTRWHNST